MSTSKKERKAEDPSRSTEHKKFQKQRVQKGKPQEDNSRLSRGRTEAASLTGPAECPALAGGEPSPVTVKLQNPGDQDKT